MIVLWRWYIAAIRCLRDSMRNTQTDLQARVVVPAHNCQGAISNRAARDLAVAAEWDLRLSLGKWICEGKRR